MSAPKCRLYLVVPSGIDAASARACLLATIAAGDVAALKVTGAAGEQAQLLDAVQAPAQEAGIAVLTEDDVDLAVKRKTDGVEIGGDAAGLAAARRRLGDRAIVAARCGTSRHLAMQLAEAGADYVAIEAADVGGESLIAWWSALFEVPCVALVPEGELARAIADGADFIVPPAGMWQSPGAARREVARIAAMIAEAGT